MRAVTVVIPVYNAERFLPGCLAALDAQTYPDVRPVLVDDGSTDGSAAVCEAYTRRNPAARLIRKANGGAASARNAGLDAADGEYVAFWDADDLAAPWMLEALVKLCERESADIAQCALLTVPQDAKNADFTRGGDAERASGAQAIGWLYGPRYIETVSPCSKLCRREVWGGLRFPEGHICEDEAVVHEVLYRARRVARTDAALYAYRQSEHSVMRERGSLKRLDILWALERRSAFLREQGLTDLLRVNERLLTGQYIHYYNYLKRECAQNEQTRQKERELLGRFRERARADQTAGMKRKLMYAAYSLCPSAERLIHREK